MQRTPFSVRRASSACLEVVSLGGRAPAIAVPGEDEPREGRKEGYEFAFLHVKVRGEGMPTRRADG